MKFYINNKLYDIDEEELEYRLIDSGEESNIYRFENEVYKIHKNNRCVKSKLDEETTKYLKQIKTNRIIMPKELIYDNYDNFIGYTLPYLESHQKEILNRMKASKMISEFKLLEEDLIILKNNYVDLEDFELYNFIVNTGLYIIDPGSYLVSNDHTEKEMRRIEVDNKYKYLEFMINKVFPYITKLSKDKKRKLLEYISDEYLGDIFDYNYEKNETMKQYIKRIVK